ncbi:O-antigen ligase family protein [Vibrio alfacsensis]|uniref:O-antigen ligase family protein n=1 Tax=Vibrio alfacsensis TaxID=1074311 RepID=UPI004067B081
MFLLVSSVIFFFSIFIGVVNGNNISYIFYDSAGFPLYLILSLPIVIISNDKRKIDYFASYYVRFSFVFSSLSIVVYIVFYVVFGSLNLDTITLANNTIQQFINLKLGATAGVLRVNTNAVQMVFPAIFLLLTRKCKTNKDILFLGVMVIAIVVDGHRAAIISLSIMLYMYIVYYKKYFVFFAVTSLVLMIVFNQYDSIANRFNFDTESSSLRVDQVFPLLDEIESQPVIGSGFGSSASLIRNEDRPFMYEVDVLAVAMKLGVPLALLYSLSWYLLLPMKRARKLASSKMMFITLLSCGFYMTTNGGYFMSPITSVLQVILLLSFLAVTSKDKNVN